MCWNLERKRIIYEAIEESMQRKDMIKKEDIVAKNSYKYLEMEA